MNVQEFNEMVENAQFATKKEWLEFRDNVYAILNEMSEDDQKIIEEDNTLSALNWIVEGLESAEGKIEQSIRQSRNRKIKLSDYIGSKIVRITDEYGEKFEGSVIQIWGEDDSNGIMGEIEVLVNEMVICFLDVSIKEIEIIE